MRKYIILLIAIFSFTFVLAQKGLLKKAITYKENGELINARKTIDLALYTTSDKDVKLKDQSNMWFVRGEIYQAILKENTIIPNESNVLYYLEETFKSYFETSEKYPSKKNTERIKANLISCYKDIEIITIKLLSREKYEVASRMYIQATMSINQKYIPENLKNTFKLAYKNKILQEIEANQSAKNILILCNSFLRNFNTNNDIVNNVIEDQYYRNNDAETYLRKYPWGKYSSASKEKINKEKTEKQREGLKKLMNYEITMSEFERNLKRIDRYDSNQIDSLKKSFKNCNKKHVDLMSKKSVGVLSYFDEDNSVVYLSFTNFASKIFDNRNLLNRRVNIVLKYDNEIIKELEIQKCSGRQCYWYFESYFKQGLPGNIHYKNIGRISSFNNVYTTKFNISNKISNYSKIKIEISPIFGNSYYAGTVTLAEFDLSNIKAKLQEEEFLVSSYSITNAINAKTTNKVNVLNLKPIELPAKYQILQSKGGCSLYEIKSSLRLYDGEEPIGYWQLVQINDKNVDKNNINEILYMALENSGYLKLNYYTLGTDESGLYVAKPKELVYKLPNSSSITFELIKVSMLPKDFFSFELDNVFKINTDNIIYLFKDKIGKYTMYASQISSDNISFKRLPFEFNYYSVYKNLGIKYENSLYKCIPPYSEEIDYFKYGVKYRLTAKNGNTKTVYVKNSDVKNSNGIIIADKSKVKLSPIDQLCNDCNQVTNALTNEKIDLKWGEGFISIDGNKFNYDTKNINSIKMYSWKNNLYLVIVTNLRNLKILKTNYYVN